MPTLLDQPFDELPGKPNKIVVHWTAGTYTPSTTDRKHYHFIVSPQGVKGVKLAQGTYPVSANDEITDDAYAAHTAAFNTKAIGIAAACMLAASPGYGGDYPLTKPLWEGLARLAGELAYYYDIEIGPLTVLMHAEARKFTPGKNLGKWDISELPFNRELNALRVHEEFRNKARWYKNRLKTRLSG